MTTSQLVGIIRRLEAMLEDTESEVQVRRFEKEGNERCIITYDTKTETFELLETSTQQVYQFDDVDLVAMEIFEVLQD
ncbi:YkuJ family protein [Carnobacterium pleistocenium]|uniref:YkuJ family protein n=1 Tax=Carnobacterium pleistocenium TaxID=181073 RepID=UPI0005536814|nr:YkuJ family protein [Carnobacterium pleistocenium]